MVAERALRGGGRRAGALYAAGALTTAVGATGLVHGSRQALKPVNKADGLLKTGLKGQVDAVKSRKEETRDRKRFAQNVAISTAGGIAGSLAYGRRVPNAPGRANLVGVATGAATAGTVTALRRRSSPKRPSSQASSFDSRNGASKTAFRMATVPSDRRFAKARVVDVAKAVTAEEQRKILQRRQRNANATTLSSTVGLAGAATFGAAQLKTKGKVGRFVARNRAGLERASLGTAVGGGAISGITGLQGASVARQGVAQERERLGFRKGMPTMPSLHVPTGLRQRKTYTASSVRATRTGRLVRTKAGVR